MQLEIDVVLDYQLAEPADILLQVEVAQMADQRLLGDRLTVTSPEPLRPVDGEDAIGRRTWARGEGTFRATYSALVAVERPAPDLASLAADCVRALPALVTPYLLPSRYVEADRFESFVDRRFGALEGGAKVRAMADWIAAELDYTSGASNGGTGAADTFVKRQGVCRDYAHLLAAFARAAAIPARIASGYAPGVSPPDFHAVAEVWLAGGWRLVDPTGMSDGSDFARIGVGRDATDIAFMTVFGSAELKEQRVTVTCAG